MGWFPCCLCTTYSSDDFNRADGAVGSGWSASSGTWAIASNKLSTSSASALLLNATSGSTSAHVVNVTLRGDTDGDTIRVIVAYTDASNYLFVEFAIGDCGTLKFCQRASGSDTQLGETRSLPLAKDTDHQVRVCYLPEAYPEDGRLGVIWDDSGTDRFDFEAVNATGTDVGLGTGATVTGTVTFDTWSHRGHSADQVCCEDCDEPMNRCSIFSDDFNRADSSDIGCRWEETSGAWSISSNTLTTSSASAVALSEIRHPRPIPQSIVQVDAAATANGDSIKVIVDWLDSSNYHYAEFTWGASSAGQLDLVAVSGGSPTTLESINFTHDYTSGGVTLKVCMQPNSIEATATGPGLSENILAETTSNNGRRAGVGTGTASGALTFDDFTWLKHKSDDDPTCQDCVTGDYTCIACKDSAQPSHYKLTISGFVDSGSCTDVEEEINGTWVIPACSLAYTNGFSSGGTDCDSGFGCTYWKWTDRPPYGSGVTVCTGVPVLETAVAMEIDITTRFDGKTVIDVIICKPVGGTIAGHRYQYVYPTTDKPDCTAIAGLVIPWHSNTVDTSRWVTTSSASQAATITLTAL